MKQERWRRLCKWMTMYKESSHRPWAYRWQEPGWKPISCHRQDRQLPLQDGYTATYSILQHRRHWHWWEGSSGLGSDWSFRQYTWLRSRIPRCQAGDRIWRTRKYRICLSNSSLRLQRQRHRCFGMLLQELFRHRHCRSPSARRNHRNRCRQSHWQRARVLQEWWTREARTTRRFRQGWSLSCHCQKHDKW